MKPAEDMRRRAGGWFSGITKVAASLMLPLGTRKKKRRPIARIL